MSDAFMEIDTMGERTDNQYLLALAIARRVRKLRAGAPALVDDIENSRRRPFQAAMEEFAKRKVLYNLDEEKQ
ncbi:MAG: DNA-directed RNA polymerase subunit omega [Candidatus Fermentibacteraceae bacterium]|nr:DNA-directed RNA polymerase subunit omega [Candidatus Fermentibacteraceae bacterium]MBN2608279.1 DNA-directed RNA polymerase subunit omega [Candidatus Fermentibacteraceae bacterium]